MTNDRKCSCGTTLQEFLHSNRVGCSNCYVVFSNEILGLLRKEQQFVVPTANKPVANMAISFVESGREHLEALLREAVDREEYEIAAKIRDRLRTWKEVRTNE